MLTDHEREMTLPELARQLEPITLDALASSNPDVLAVATILAAIMGCIAEGPVDQEALWPLVLTAGAICEHRSDDQTPAERELDLDIARQW